MSKLPFAHNSKRFPLIHLGVLIALLALLAPLRVATLKQIPPEADRAQYLAFAYNSLKYGQFDDNRTDVPRYGNRREPGYPLLLMAAMLVHPGIDLDNQNAACITEGVDPHGQGAEAQTATGECLRIITWLKIANLICLWLTGILAFYVVWHASGRSWAAYLAFAAITFSHALNAQPSRFMSEPLAALLLLGASFLLMRTIERPTPSRAVAAGLAMGALTLTKALFLYVSIFLILLIPPFLLLTRSARPMKALRVGLGAFIGLAILVGPWMVRNAIQVDSFSVAGRDGLMLMYRVGMNEELAEDPPDLSWPGSKTTTSAYKDVRDRGKTRVRALRQRIMNEYDLGAMEAGLMLRSMAVERIMADPIAHLRFVPYSLWLAGSFEKGIGLERAGRADTYDRLGQAWLPWPEGGLEWKLPYWDDLLFWFGVLSPLLWLALRKWPMLWFLAPSAVAYGLLVLLFYVISRFMQPFIPILVVNLAIAVALLPSTLSALRWRIPLMLRTSSS